MDQITLGPLNTTYILCVMLIFLRRKFDITFKFELLDSLFHAETSKLHLTFRRLRFPCYKHFNERENASSTLLTQIFEEQFTLILKYKFT